MEKEFIPYEQAIELKQLGFDEPCLAFYDGKETNQVYYNSIRNGSGDYEPFKNNERLKWFGAPLYQQALRWFREVHNLRGFIGYRPNVKKFDYHIYDMGLSGMDYVKGRGMEEWNKDPLVGTYEEAELGCLKQLIKIIKTK